MPEAQVIGNQAENNIQNNEDQENGSQTRGVVGNSPENDIPNNDDQEHGVQTSGENESNYHYLGHQPLRDMKSLHALMFVCFSQWVHGFLLNWSHFPLDKHLIYLTIFEQGFAYKFGMWSVGYMLISVGLSETFFLPFSHPTVTSSLLSLQTHPICYFYLRLT